MQLFCSWLREDIYNKMNEKLWKYSTFRCCSVCFLKVLCSRCSGSFHVLTNVCSSHCFKLFLKLPPPPPPLQHPLFFSRVAASPSLLFIVILYFFSQCLLFLKRSLAISVPFFLFLNWVFLSCLERGVSWGLVSTNMSVVLHVNWLGSSRRHACASWVCLFYTGGEYVCFWWHTLKIKFLHTLQVISWSRAGHKVVTVCVYECLWEWGVRNASMCVYHSLPRLMQPHCDKGMKWWKPSLF